MRVWEVELGKAVADGNSHNKNNWTGCSPLNDLNQSLCLPFPFSMLFSPIFQRYSFSNVYYSFFNLCVSYWSAVVGKILYLAIFFGCKYF